MLKQNQDDQHNPTVISSFGVMDRIEISQPEDFSTSIVFSESSADSTQYQLGCKKLYFTNKKVVGCPHQEQHIKHDDNFTVCIKKVKTGVVSPLESYK